MKMDPNRSERLADAYLAMRRADPRWRRSSVPRLRVGLELWWPATKAREHGMPEPLVHRVVQMMTTPGDVLDLQNDRGVVRRWRRADLRSAFEAGHCQLYRGGVPRQARQAILQNGPIDPDELLRERRARRTWFFGRTLAGETGRVDAQGRKPA